MRLTSTCIACQVWVRLHDLTKIIDSDDERVVMLTQLLLEESKAVRNGVNNPAVLGTLLFRLVKRITGVDDPYRDEKIRANTMALKVYEKLNSEEIPLDLALKISAYANSLDLGVAGYRPPRPEEVVDMARKISIINAGKALKVLESANKILFLLDNAGESVFDRLLADTLTALGKKVIGVVKSKPFQNDETITDVEYSRIDESFHAIIETGSDAASIFLSECSREVKEAIKRSDVIIAKGMAHYEYLTDIEDKLGKTIIYILTAKCDPVAKSLNTLRGRAVVRVYNPF